MVTARRGEGRDLRNAAISGGAISLLVEGCQLFLSSRTPSVLDILTNVTGAVLGAASFMVVVRVLSRQVGRRSFVGLPAAVFAASYLIATFGEALVPLFRQEYAVPGVGGGPFRRFRMVVDAFSWDSLTDPPILDALLFLPAGFLLVVWMVEVGLPYRRAARASIAALVGLTLLAEVLHGFLGLPILPGAVLNHALASAAGAVLASWALPGFSRRFRGRARGKVVLGAYLPFLLLWAWRPYRLETRLPEIVGQLRSGWWKPLNFLGMRVDLFSVVDILTPFFLYFPVGALLAVWPVKVKGPLAAILPALYLAILAEMGQLFVASRLLDVTDMLVPMAGAAAGWVVLRRSGFRRYGSLF
jgi:VanZ family protein